MAGASNGDLSSLEDHGPTENGTERVAKFVGEHGQKLIFRQVCFLCSASGLTLHFDRALALRNISDGGDNKNAVGRVNWAEPNLNGNFRAILANSIKITAGSHRTLTGAGQIFGAVFQMMVAETFRDELLNGHPDHLVG